MQAADARGKRIVIRATGGELLGLLIVLLFAPANAHAQDCFVDVSYPDFSYQQLYRSLRAVDFRNFTFYEFDEKGRPSDSLKLTAGKYERRYELGGDWAGLGRVRQMRSTSEGPQRAVVDFNIVRAGGSSTAIGFIQVFELASGKLVVRQQITYGGKGDAGLSYDSKRKLLTVKIHPLCRSRYED
ncbi:MAG: hypothetical protein ACRD2Q_09390 [Terriglobales bacterium]